MSANISCAQCGGLIENNPSLAGQQISCPHCDGLVVMPGKATPPPRRKPVPNEQVEVELQPEPAVKKQMQPWLKYGLIAFASLIVLRGCIGILGGGTNQTMLEEVSGVWQGVSDGTVVTIDLTGSNKFIQFGNGQRTPFSIKDIDPDEDTIALIGKTLDGQSVVWTIQQNWDAKGEYFTLILITHTGNSDELDFVRRL